MKKASQKIPAKLIIFDLDDTLFDTTGQLKGSWDGIPFITPFEGVKEMLGQLPAKKVLVSQGNSDIQNKKIDVLGIRSFFDEIVLCSSDAEKHACFAKILAHFNITDPLDVIVVGNRLDSEVRYGKMLGCKTAWVRHGKYADRTPVDAFEEPDFTVLKTIEVENLLK